MSDTWDDLQAFKIKQISLKERLQKRKKKREKLLNAVSTLTDVPNLLVKDERESDRCEIIPEVFCSHNGNTEVEKQLLLCLCDILLILPTDSHVLTKSVSHCLRKDIPSHLVENLLQKFAAQTLLSIEESTLSDGKPCIKVISTEHTRLTAVANGLNISFDSNNCKRQKYDDAHDIITQSNKEKVINKDEDILSLLSMPTIKQKENKKVGEEILELLSKPTAKEVSMTERFKSQGTHVKEFCSYGTRVECDQSRGNKVCYKLHFKKIIQKHTDETLGDCSFLNTCFHMDTCKYVHYEVDTSGTDIPNEITCKKDKDMPRSSLGQDITVLFKPQWIQCDLRYFDMTILGKFAVVMADPPWDIHMELPYGTMSDDEMRALNIPCLQDEGLIFLWVTGRAMELGRECLSLWGYERIDELIWVKTNQLQRIIRTGRTGHWLNHGKVGMKGNPKTVNRGLDCDVLVAEVRATSHKPDEIYGIIERLSPGTRKIELFGREHNVQPNWITLGNQLPGVQLLDPELSKAFKIRYTDGNALIKPS